MKKIKIISILLVLSLVTFGLAACDGGSNAIDDINNGNGNDNGETQIGTRDNPVEIGNRLNLSYETILQGDVEMEIVLLETIRGEEANKMVEEANMFNPEPEEGEEYLLAKFEVKAVYIEEEPLSINHAQFDAVRDKGTVYDEFLSVSGLEPDLRNDLYQDATHIGWTYFLIEKEDNPLIAYHRNRDYEVWFNPSE